VRLARMRHALARAHARSSCGLRSRERNRFNVGEIKTARTSHEDATAAFRLAHPTRARQPCAARSRGRPRQVFGLMGGALGVPIYYGVLPRLRAQCVNTASFPITAAGQLRNKSSYIRMQDNSAPDSLLGPPVGVGTVTDHKILWSRQAVKRGCWWLHSRSHSASEMRSCPGQVACPANIRRRQAA
jgi:hypothetical protein